MLHYFIMGFRLKLRYHFLIITITFQKKVMGTMFVLLFYLKSMKKV